MTPRERLSTARLYLVCPARSREWIAAAVRGGVDLVQLRDKSPDTRAQIVRARTLIGARLGAPLSVLVVLVGTPVILWAWPL